MCSVGKKDGRKRKGFVSSRGYDGAWALKVRKGKEGEEGRLERTLGVESNNERGNVDDLLADSDVLMVGKAMMKRSVSRWW